MQEQNRQSLRECPFCGPGTPYTITATNTTNTATVGVTPVEVTPK